MKNLAILFVVSVTTLLLIGCKKQAEDEAKQKQPENLTRDLSPVLHGSVWSSPAFAYANLTDE